MNCINVLKNLVLKSQFYVSFCATLLGIFVLKEQESYQYSLAVVLFLTFWNGYIFTVFHKKKDAIFINLVGFALITFLIFTFINLEFFIKWLIILLLGSLYNADFFKLNFREFSLIKTFYVGFVWAMSLVWLPLNNENLCIDFSSLFSSDFIRCFINSSLRDFPIHWFFIIFFFVSGITFPFEIRDLERDQFPTLPKVLGVKNTKYLSYIFLFLSSVLAAYFLKFDFAISFFLTSIFAFTLIYFSDKKREDVYYSFLMESLSLLPLFFYELTKIF